MYLNTGSLSVKYLFYIFIFLQHVFISNKIIAQSGNNIHTDPLSTNSLSGSYSNFNYMFDWNIGEVFSTPYSNFNTILITPGFLQSFDLETIIYSSGDAPLKIDTIQKYIKAYPNPVKTDLHIQLLQLNLKILSISLLNQNGHSLELYDEQFNTQVHYSKTIAMGKYAPNLYLLSIRYVLKGNLYRTKIIKIIKL